MRPILLAFLAACLLPLSVAADDVPRPNIVLILADDLGYGDVGCYNPASKIPTPHIDRLATAGTRFTDAHSPASVCVPTRYSLLTGRYPFRRPDRNGAYNAGPLIDDGVPTLPSVLRSAGYHTAMIGKWHLGFEFSSWNERLSGGPVDRGFDSYFGVPASTDIPPYFFVANDRAVAGATDRIEEHHSEGVRAIQGAFWRAGGIAPGLKLEEVLPTFAAKALAELDALAQHPDQPFFLELALTAPHTPWLPAERFRGKSGAGDYGDFVVQVDDLVGQVLDRLESHKLADDTIVIFTSDNGPTWYDEDVARYGHDSAGPWRGMKGDVWEAGHRIPFIVRWPGPGHVPAGRTNDSLLSQVDLFATFAAAAGADLPESAAPDSENLLPIWLGLPKARSRQTLVAQSSGGTLALRKGAWKFVPQFGSSGFSEPKKIKPAPGEPAVQLYDLEADTGETHNLAAEKPEVVAELARLLQQLESSERTAQAH